MSPNDIQAALADHAFQQLFIECLGWDRLRTDVLVQHDGFSFELEAVAQKRGFAAFACPAHRTVLANRRMLRVIQRQLRKSYHEHILIHYCETPRKQVWQWSTLVEGGRHIQHREHPFFSNQPPPRLLERIRGLAVPLEEEEQLSLVDVLARVRTALQPDADYNLFAKYPWYAAKSDRLAMALKNGVPGAFQEFVEFHIPLARHSSKRMIRWFGMDPEDAEQTAVIGLLEAARRFEPDRGYQFSTYASHWIRNACQRYGLEWGLPIHVPTYYFWTCYKLMFVEMQLIATHGEHGAREHFERELAEAGVTQEQWQHFRVARHVDLFSEFDRQARKDLDRPAKPCPIIEGDEEVCREIRGLMDSLQPRLATILRLRYGIGHPEHTLQEVADHLGLTRERVRQLQRAAEKKLSRYLRKRGYGHDFEEIETSETEQTESRS